MSGAAGDGGYDYQADGFAYVATYMLACRPLGWFEALDDTPLSIAMETDGPR